MKIISIHLAHLRNEAHFAFFTDFIALLTKFPIVRGKLGLLLDTLFSLYAKEDEAVDFIRKSDYTAQIAAADKRLDNAVVGFHEFVRGALHHFNPAVSEAALSLKNLLKNYGDVIHKNYDEERAAIINLLQDLDGVYRLKVEQISGLYEWVEEIRVANAALSELLAMRNTELANRTKEKMNAVRREIDPAYRAVITRVDALVNIEGETEYAAFIDELNTLIERFNKHIHTTKTDDKKPKESE